MTAAITYRLPWGNLPAMVGPSKKGSPAALPGSGAPASAQVQSGTPAPGGAEARAKAPEVDPQLAALSQLLQSLPAAALATLGLAPLPAGSSATAAATPGATSSGASPSAAPVAVAAPRTATPSTVPHDPCATDPYESTSALPTEEGMVEAEAFTDGRYGPGRFRAIGPGDPFDPARWDNRGWPSLTELQTTRFRSTDFFRRVDRLSFSSREEAITRRYRGSGSHLRVPEYVPSDLPVLRDKAEVHVLRNLAHLEANSPVAQYGPGGEPVFHLYRVCSDLSPTPWWRSESGTAVVREEFRCRFRTRKGASSRHGALLVGFDALQSEYPLLSPDQRDAFFLLRPSWWPEMTFPAAPFPEILAYRGSHMRDPQSNKARVLWEVALADSVVANLNFVLYTAWCGDLLSLPPRMMRHFETVDARWFADRAGYHPEVVREVLVAIRDADWTRALTRGGDARHRYLPFDWRRGRSTSPLFLLTELPRVSACLRSTFLASN